MTTHSSTLAWKIPWKEEAGGLQSMESQRVRHDLSDQESARQGIKVGNNPQHCVSHRRIHICMSIFQRYTCKSAKSFKLSSFIHSFLVIPQPYRNLSFPSTYFTEMSFIFIGHYGVPPVSQALHTVQRVGRNAPPISGLNPSNSTTCSTIPLSPASRYSSEQGPVLVECTFQRVRQCRYHWGRGIECGWAGRSGRHVGGQIRPPQGRDI